MPVHTSAVSTTPPPPQINTVPNGAVATGVDLVWVTDNAEEIAKQALASLGYKWDSQSVQNRKNWVENVHLFAEAALYLAKKERKASGKA